MKRILVFLLAAVMVIGISVPAYAKQKNKSLQEILDLIQDDYDSYAAGLEEEKDALLKGIGDTWEGYIKNKEDIFEWLDSVRSVTQEFYEEINNECVSYYKTVTDELDMSDYSEWSDALQDLMDLVYEDIYDKVYDDVYESVYTDVQDQINDNILDDIPEDIDSDDWYDELTEFSDRWLAASSLFYDELSEAEEDFIIMHNDVDYAFYDGEYDVDKILSQEVDKKLEKLLAAMEKDFNDTGKSLSKELDKVYKALGNTEKSYKAGYSELEDWYDLLLTESEDLYERTKDNAIEYYKTTVLVCNMGSRLEWNSALNAFYRRIYRTAYKNWKQEILTGLMNGLYKKYYKEFFNSIKSSMDSNDWYDGRYDFYNDYSDVQYDFMDAWSESRSRILSDWYEAKWAFEDGTKDLDKVFGKDEKDDKKSVDTSGGVKDSKTDGKEIRKEIKEAIDAYEAAVDEYCAFMKSFDPDDISKLSDYLDFVSKQEEALKKFEKIQDKDLNDAERAYYSEVAQRCLKKMADSVN